MGQVESAVFEDTPPWDLKRLLKLTDMTETELDSCWKIWSADHPKGKIDFETFKTLFNIEGKSKLHYLFNVKRITLYIWFIKN